VVVGVPDARLMEVPCAFVVLNDGASATEADLLAWAKDRMAGFKLPRHLILVDGFDANAHAGALDTLPFYQACHARLAEDGLLVVNLLGRNRGVGTSMERIAAAFDKRSLIFASCDSGNAIAFAATGAALEINWAS
jgi:spermidine synthase